MTRRKVLLLHGRVHVNHGGRWVEVGATRPDPQTSWVDYLERKSGWWWAGCLYLAVFLTLFAALVATLINVEL